MAGGRARVEGLRRAPGGVAYGRRLAPGATSNCIHRRRRSARSRNAGAALGNLAAARAHPQHRLPDSPAAARRRRGHRSRTIRRAVDLRRTPRRVRRCCRRTITPATRPVRPASLLSREVARSHGHDRAMPSTRQRDPPTAPRKESHTTVPLPTAPRPSRSLSSTRRGLDASPASTRRRMRRQAYAAGTRAPAAATTATPST